MNLTHKVPKGIMETPSLILGVTIEQFIILCVIGVIASIFIFVFDEISMIMIGVWGSIIMALYAYMTIANSKFKGYFSETCHYVWNKMTKPQRFTG